MKFHEAIAAGIKHIEENMRKFYNFVGLTHPLLKSPDKGI